MLADWHFCTIKRFLYCTVTRLFCRDSAFEAQGLGAKIASAGISQVSFAAFAAAHSRLATNWLPSHCSHSGSIEEHKYQVSNGQWPSVAGR